MTALLVLIGSRVGWLLETDDRERVAAFVGEIRAAGDMRDGHG